MANHLYHANVLEILVNDIATALKRPEALVRLTAASVDIKVRKGCVSLDDAILLIRYFSDRSFDQEEFLANHTFSWPKPPRFMIICENRQTSEKKKRRAETHIAQQKQAF